HGRVARLVAQPARPVAARGGQGTGLLDPPPDRAVGRVQGGGEVDLAPGTHDRLGGLDDQLEGLAFEGEPRVTQVGELPRRRRRGRGVGSRRGRAGRGGGGGGRRTARSASYLHLHVGGIHPGQRRDLAGER